MTEKFCKYFGKCGGCNFLDIDYQTELVKKHNYVGQQLSKNGIDVKVDDIVKMYYPYEYRNKLHLAITQKKGVVSVGFFEPGTKNIIDIDSCLLFDDWAQKLAGIVKKWVIDFKIIPYDRITRAGTIKYVVARNFKNNLMLTLVATSQNFAGKEQLYKELKKNFGDVSLWLNINKRTDSAVFGDTFLHKYGEQKLDAVLCGIKFKLSPNSFAQTNYEMASKIYTAVCLEVKNCNVKNVVDLYSGIGITSCMFAKLGMQVLSIEVEKSSVVDARNIARENGVDKKITSLCGKCENLTDQIESFANNEDVCVFVDPARSGVEQNVLETIISVAPKKIIYMSCEPVTLSRDLAFLLDSKRYHLDKVIPFDMFPKTKHLEVLAVLSLTK